MNNIKKIVEDKGFNVNVCGNYVELETWTKEGVNMIIETSVKDCKGDLLEYINYFDVEEELKAHLEDSRYSSNIGVKRGLIDFEDYYKTLLSIKRELVLREQLLEDHKDILKAFEETTGDNLDSLDYEELEEAVESVMWYKEGSYTSAEVITILLLDPDLGPNIEKFINERMKENGGYDFDHIVNELRHEGFSLEDNYAIWIQY